MQKDSISFFAAELPEHKGMQSLTNQVYLRDGKLKISILNLVFYTLPFVTLLMDVIKE